MHVRNSMRIITLRSFDRSCLILVALSAFFLVGSFAGARFFEIYSVDVRTDVAVYLIDFCEVARSTTPKASFFQTLVLFFFYPTAVFLSGISPLGVILIPCLSFCLGFGVLFAIQCFLAVFSRAGIYPAMALLSVRLGITLICFLSLAVEVLPQAWRIAQVTIRNRKFSGSVYCGRRLLTRVLFCLVVMIAGVCCERFLTPVLFRLALNELF